jgi:hypothetical protein
MPNVNNLSLSLDQSHPLSLSTCTNNLSQPLPAFFKYFIQICDLSILQHVSIHTFLNKNSHMFASILIETRKLPQTHPITLSLSLLLSNYNCETCQVNLYQKPIRTCTKQFVPTICTNRFINQTGSSHQDQSPKQL